MNQLCSQSELLLNAYIGFLSRRKSGKILKLNTNSNVVQMLRMIEAVNLYLHFPSYAFTKCTGLRLLQQDTLVDIFFILFNNITF